MTHVLTKLPYRFLSVKGIDAEKFLQGQCSCDLRELESDNFTLGTLNDPKGRMYGLFKIIRIKDGFLASFEQSTFDTALSKLNKYAVFFKCELLETNYSSFGSDSREIQGVFPNFDSKATKIGDDHCLAIKLPGQHQLYEIWANSEASSFYDPKHDNACVLNDWLACETLDGIPQLYEQTQGKFILQELNLQELGAVSFKKGCYTGQEIIARIKFLGKSKKRMFLLQGTTNSVSSGRQPSLGAAVHTATGQKIGKLIRFHSSQSAGLVALAVLNQDLIKDFEEVYIEDLEAELLKVQDINYKA